MADIKVIKVNDTPYNINDATARGNMANEYSASSTYTKDEYCMKDGVVYKAKQNISPAEAWNSAHWDAVKIMNELSGTQGGTVASANKLTTARSIDGVNFDGTAGIIHYGLDNIAADNDTRAVLCTGFVKGDGARVIVRFGYGWNQGAASGDHTPTLNVNSTGAYKIYYRGSALTKSKKIMPGDVIEFVFDSALDTGGAYTIVGVLQGALDSNVSGLTTSKTLTALSIQDGEILGTANPISITRSQVSDVASMLTYYGVCDATLTTPAKTVSVATGFTLATGATVRVKFTNGNAATDMTLNVNSTGAKNVLWHGIHHYDSQQNEATAQTPDMILMPNSVVDFVYDGTAYNIVDNGLFDTFAYYDSVNEALAIYSYETNI